MGPGGMKCACCGPAPGKAKKDFIRHAKKIEKSQAMREARKEAE